MSGCPRAQSYQRLPTDVNCASSTRTPDDSAHGSPQGSPLEAHDMKPQRSPKENKNSSIFMEKDRLAFNKPQVADDEDYSSGRVKIRATRGAPPFVFLLVVEFFS